MEVAQFYQRLVHVQIVHYLNEVKLHQHRLNQSYRLNVKLQLTMNLVVNHRF